MAVDVGVSSVSVSMLNTDRYTCWVEDKNIECRAMIEYPPTLLPHAMDGFVIEDGGTGNNEWSKGSG